MSHITHEHRPSRSYSRQPKEMGAMCRPAKFDKNLFSVHNGRSPSRGSAEQGEEMIGKPTEQPQPPVPKGLARRVQRALSPLRHNVSRAIKGDQDDTLDCFLLSLCASHR